MREGEYGFCGCTLIVCNPRSCFIAGAGMSLPSASALQRAEGRAAACAEIVTCTSRFSGGRIRAEPAGDPLAVAVVERRELAGDDPGSFVHLLGCRGGVLMNEQAPQLA